MSSDWLDDRVRKMELEKIKKMQENIGYPKWYNNVTLLNNHYRGVSFTRFILKFYFFFNLVKTSQPILLSFSSYQPDMISSVIY